MLRPLQRSYNYIQIWAERLPNKMTLAVSSRWTRWALWASQHLHASWMEGQEGEAWALFCSSMSPTFLLFMWKQMTDSHSGVFPGQWKTRCGYSDLNTNRRSRGLTVRTVQWHGGLFGQCLCIKVTLLKNENDLFRILLRPSLFIYLAFL